MSQFKSQFMNIMLERGFYNQCTNEDGFDTYLYQCETSGKPAVGYLGSDPTGDSLHVGHIVPLMMMRWFQKCGHKPLTLVGGATARIGDPSGKDKLRPFLDEETLAHNVAGLKNLFQNFLNSAPEPRTPKWLTTGIGSKTSITSLFCAISEPIIPSTGC